MLSTLIVSNDKKFTDIIIVITQNEYPCVVCNTFKAASEILVDTPVDLLILDESLPDTTMTCRQFIEAAILKKPMLHCAVSSSLSPESFHQSYEGMGVLMQLTVAPRQAEGLMLLDRINNIATLQVGIKRELA